VPFFIQTRATIASAMQRYEWNQVEKEQLNPAFARQVIHGETMTVARVYLKKGCLVPEHSHHNEQISMMEQGTLRFVLAGEELILKAGQVLRIPPHVPHSAEALEDSIAVDLFSPIREDWIRGDDAYLRK
jgi:quercetin dioxygenase-like cupin family protein